MESYPTAPGKKFVRYSLFEVPTLFMILCALVALGFSGFGVNHFVWQQRFAATALPARGVVTRVEANHSDGTTGCTPTVRYTPAS
ncbi:MAG: hypothetical protein H8F28_28260, partial [Fibrella sp.]|nr:hypothetical protein [Armatimonadota bacterium]